MQITNNSCINFNLPEYKRLKTLYGELSSIEIINYLSSNEFINWYGYDMFPIITNHTIINNKGNIIDLRGKIRHTSYFYNKHINDSKNNLLETDYNNLISGKILSKKEHLLSSIFKKNVNVLPNVYINNDMNTQEIINYVISEYLNKINNKTFKSADEIALINGDIDINRYFGLDNVTYKYDNKINNLDNIVTIKQKLNNIFNNEYKKLLDKYSLNIKGITFLDSLGYDSFTYEKTLYINSNKNDLNNLSFAKNLVKSIIYDNIEISDELYNYVNNNIIDSLDVMTNKESFKEALFFNDSFNKILKESDLHTHINSQLNTGSLFSIHKKNDNLNIYTDSFITQQKLEQCQI